MKLPVPIAPSTAARNGPASKPSGAWAAFSLATLPEADVPLGVIHQQDHQLLLGLFQQPSLQSCGYLLRAPPATCGHRAHPSTTFARSSAPPSCPPRIRLQPARAREVAATTAP